MSLLVAQMTARGPRIVSDMRVTLPYEANASPRTDVLKLVVLSKTLVVGFAGSVSVGLRTIRLIARQLNEAPSDLDPLQVMAEHSRNGDVEFLCATASPKHSIARVRDGHIQRELEVGWIGDAQAFNIFQEERNRDLAPHEHQDCMALPPHLQIASRLAAAMKHVIADPSVPQVDGCLLDVALLKDGFNYLPHTYIHVGRNVSIASGDDLIARMLQPVEHGGYAVTLVEPEFPGTPVVALNYPSARLTYVYMPLQLDEPLVLRDVRSSDLVETLRSCGVRMSQPMIVERPAIK